MSYRTLPYPARHYPYRTIPCRTAPYPALLDTTPTAPFHAIPYAGLELFRPQSTRSY